MRIVFVVLSCVFFLFLKIGTGDAYACGGDFGCSTMTCSVGMSCFDTYQNVTCGSATGTIIVGICTCPPGGCAGSACTSNAQCGGTKVCCKGSCVGAGQCGGGGLDTQNGPSCGAGYAVDYTQPISSMCGLPTNVNYVPGNAQRQEGCCKTAGGKKTCGDWYDCPTPNNPNKMCRDCEEEEEYCAKYTWTTYACKSTCTPSCGAPLCGQADGCGGACANTDANAWQILSPCNATCGPGTQTWINGCGATQDLSCNTQPCGASPWWQVKDSDISNNSGLITNVPIGKYFDLDGDGGFPGIPAVGVYRDLDGTDVSSTGWLVDSLQTNPKVYDHAYFNNQIPKDTVITVVPSNTIDGSILESGGTLSYGYYWYRYDGSSGLDLTITAPIDLGSRKVILLVDSASLYINGSINLTDGEGFFMASVGKTVGLTKGNIYIDPSVGSGMPDLEGIYRADGIFNTGASVVPLTIRGSVVGYDGVAMARDLGGALNVTTPSELFEYAPDQIMLYPSRLGSRKINWKEVAP